MRQICGPVPQASFSADLWDLGKSVGRWDRELTATGETATLGETGRRVLMTTIVIPPDLEEVILEEADRRGMAPEAVAVDGLRRLFATPVPGAELVGGGSLFEFLEGYTGKVNGVSEAFSEECGRRFADGLAEEYERGRL